MKIEYMGQSCFHLTTEDDLSIVIDPFCGSTQKPLPMVSADVTVISHNHEDHSNLEMIMGKTQVVTGTGNRNFGDVSIKGYIADHGQVEGNWLGMVVCYTIFVDGLNLLHLSDMGVVPSEKELKEMGSPDILFVPVGGHFTIGPFQAYELSKRLDPRIVIPMHYATAGTDRIKYPIGESSPFTEKFRKVKTIRTKYVEICMENLPEKQEAWVMTPQY